MMPISTFNRKPASFSVHRGMQRMLYSSQLFDPQRPNSHYQNLELVPGPSLTQKRIKQQYQKLAMQWHPDRNSSDDAKERFTRITESYKLLSNPGDKRSYDNWILGHGQQQSQKSTSSGVAWAQSSRMARQAAAEQFRDRRAESFEDLRRQMNNKQQQQNNSSRNNFHYSSGASSNAQYRSAIHSVNTGVSTARDRMESDQHNARKDLMRQDKLKFSITMFITMLIFYWSSRRSTNAESSRR